MKDENMPPSNMYCCPAVVGYRSVIQRRRKIKTKVKVRIIINGRIPMLGGNAHRSNRESFSALTGNLDIAAVHRDLRGIYPWWLDDHLERLGPVGSDSDRSGKPTVAKSAVNGTGSTFY